MALVPDDLIFDFFVRSDSGNSGDLSCTVGPQPPPARNVSLNIIRPPM